MATKMSRALSPEKVIAYWVRDLSSGSERSYYLVGMTRDGAGTWFGREAEAFGLIGKPVTLEYITRLALGQNPNTAEQLIDWRPPAKREAAWVRDGDRWRARLIDLFASAVADARDPLRQSQTVAPPAAAPQQKWALELLARH